MARTPAPELSRTDWIAAALDALGGGGVEAVRIETLARALRVTKGSFYWHFKDRRALLDSMAKAWEQRSTLGVIAIVEARGGTGPERLRRLVSICFRGGEIDRLENAVRQWASTDDVVRPVLARVDAARLTYGADLLVAAGFGIATARARSRIMYLAMIGEFAWTSHGGAATPRPTIKALTELLLTPE